MHPKIGVGVFIFNEDGKFVLGQRKGSHGAGKWALPGGHLEFKESIEGCAAREVREETGLDVVDLRFLTLTNDIMEEENKHYVTLFVGCKVKDLNKQPEVLESDKCYGWKWVAWKELQSWDNIAGKDNLQESHDTSHGATALFLPLLNLFKQHPTFYPLEAWESLRKLD